MALSTLEGRTPTSIKAVTVHLFSVIEMVDEVPTDVRRVHFTIVPADQNEVDMNPINGDLVPHLTPEQIAALQSFMDDMRALAVAALPSS